MTRAALLALLCLAPGVAHAQLLSRASDAVRGGSSQSDDDDSSSSYDYDDDDDDYGGDDNWSDNDDGLLGRASRSVRGSSGSASRGGSPFGGGRSEPSVDLSFFAPCPYDAGVDGYVLEPTQPGGARRLARPVARMSAEVGYAIEGAARGGLSLRFSVPFLLDFRVRYSTFLESTDDGWLGAMLGRIGLELRLLESAKFIFRLGVAGLHFHDADGAVPGLEGSMSADWFIAEPVVLSAEFGAGFVGEAVSLSARLTVGTMIDATELFVGYHYEGLLVSDQHVHLGGPVAGVRGWL